MRTTTIAAALLAIGSLATAVPAAADEAVPGWLTVPETLRGVIEVDARTSDTGGQYYVLQMDRAGGSCDGPARLQADQWADQLVTVTEPAELESLATGEPVTVEPGTYQARLCDPDYEQWGTVWVGDEPANLDDDLAFYWTLPEGAAEALVWQSDLPRELTADAELRTQPSMDAPLVGTTIPAGSEVYSALALEDLSGQMGWIAMQTEDGTAGWAPHWSIDPGLGGWGAPGDDGIEYPPGSVLPDGTIKTAEPDPTETTVTETAGSEQTTEDVAVDTEPAEPTADSGVPWLPVALGGGGALLLAGALIGRGLSRKTEPEEG